MKLCQINELAVSGQSGLVGIPPRPGRLQRDGPTLPAQVLTQGSVVLGKEEQLLL